MSNKTQLQTNNINLDALIARVNAAKDTAASLPEAGSGGGGNSGGSKGEIDYFAVKVTSLSDSPLMIFPFETGMTWYDWMNSNYNIMYISTTGAEYQAICDYYEEGQAEFCYLDWANGLPLDVYHSSFIEGGDLSNVIISLSSGYIYQLMYYPY